MRKLSKSGIVAIALAAALIGTVVYAVVMVTHDVSMSGRVSADYSIELIDPDTMLSWTSEDFDGLIPNAGKHKHFYLTYTGNTEKGWISWISTGAPSWLQLEVEGVSGYSGKWNEGVIIEVNPGVQIEFDFIVMLNDPNIPGGTTFAFTTTFRTHDSATG